MREIRPSGSEGGVGPIPHPYPYRQVGTDCVGPRSNPPSRVEALAGNVGSRWRETGNRTTPKRRLVPHGHHPLNLASAVPGRDAYPGVHGS